MVNAVILAGGFGTRLRQAVPDIPKPMAPIRNRPFLEYLMDYWIAQGVTSFTLSVGYMKEVIIQHFGTKYNNIPIYYKIENKPLGTGGGLLLATEGFKETFLVLNGDTYCEVNLAELQTFHRKYSSQWTFTLFRSNKVGRYMGVKLIEGGRITSLQSGKGEVGELANGGVYMINPSALDHARYTTALKEKSLEDELVTDFVELGGTLYGFETSGRFIDIGVPEDYYRASDILP
jgi:D-glycero-alpha-D-manno-heptose 1-phosphate guanylyltransferase